MSAFDPKRTFTSPLLQRRYRVNLVEYLQHDGVGCRLTVERDRQVCPNYQRYIIDWIVSHARVVAGHFAAVKIHTVWPKGELGDSIRIFLAERVARVLRLRAVEPLPLRVGSEKLAPDQRAYPDGKIICGRDSPSGCEGIGRILPRDVIGLEGSRLGRSLKIGGIRRIHQGVR